MRLIVKKKPFFFFFELKPFTNSIFNTPIKKKKKLFTALPTLSITPVEVKSDGDSFFPTPSDDNSLVP